MIRWKINLKKSQITINYNKSPILSYQASCGPNSPIIDKRITHDIEYEIQKMMDVLEHREVLRNWWNNNELVIKELLGL